LLLGNTVVFLVTLPIGAAAPSGPDLMRGGVFWTWRNALANVAEPLHRRQAAIGPLPDDLIP
jgi:hypothetical protein